MSAMALQNAPTAASIPSSNRRVHFGVNYTPSHGWFFAWLNPDWDSIRHDFDQIASLGVDHVRIFPLWTLLQPNRTFINHKGLSDVRQMVQIAGSRGLNAYVDVLQGHLSSFDFVPSWLVSWHERSMFADQDCINAEAQLVSAVYGELADLGCFRGLTVGNECNQFTDPAHPRRQMATANQVHDWLDALISPIYADARKTGRVVVHGENDAVWYEDNHAFTPWDACNMGDESVVHSWVFNGVAQKYGPLSFESTHHAQYLCELARAFAADPYRLVWLQESGAPQNVMSEAQTPEFCRESVSNALSNSAVSAVTWWCSHDVSNSLADFPPLEHTLGLFDADGKLKPIGREYARLAQEAAKGEIGSVSHSSGSSVAVEVPSRGGNPLLRSAEAIGGSVFNRWMSLAQDGETPQIVSSELAQDPDYLARRGISQVISVPIRAGQKYSAVSDPAAVKQEG